MTKIKQSHQGIPLETRDGATMDLDGVGFGDIVSVTSLSKHRGPTERASCQTETQGNFAQLLSSQPWIKPQIASFSVSDCCYGYFVYRIGSFYESLGFQR